MVGILVIASLILAALSAISYAMDAEDLARLSGMILVAAQLIFLIVRAARRGSVGRFAIGWLVCVGIGCLVADSLSDGIAAGGVIAGTVMLVSMVFAARMMSAQKVHGSTETHQWLAKQMELMEAKPAVDREMVFSGVMMAVVGVANNDPEFASDEVFLELGAYHLADVSAYCETHYGAKGEHLAAELAAQFGKLMSTILQRDVSPVVAKRMRDYSDAIEMGNDPRDRVAQLTSRVAQALPDTDSQRRDDVGFEPPKNLLNYVKLQTWTIAFSKVTFNSVDELFRSEP